MQLRAAHKNVWTTLDQKSLIHLASLLIIQLRRPGKKTTYPTHRGQSLSSSHCQPNVGSEWARDENQCVLGRGLQVLYFCFHNIFFKIIIT